MKCPRCKIEMKTNVCECGYVRGEKKGAVKPRYDECAKCHIVLPPVSQVWTRQRKGEPCATGVLCGRREYYLCIECWDIANGKAKPKGATGQSAEVAARYIERMRKGIGDIGSKYVRGDRSMIVREADGIWRKEGGKEYR